MAADMLMTGEMPPDDANCGMAHALRSLPNVESIRAVDAGEIECPPPPNAKLVVRMCMMHTKIEKLEAECTRLHNHWHAAEERANVAQAAYTDETQSTMDMAKRILELETENENCRLAMCRYGAAFAADTLSGVIVRTIEVLNVYRQREADESADEKPDGQVENATTQTPT